MSMTLLPLFWRLQPRRVGPVGEMGSRVGYTDLPQKSIALWPRCELTGSLACLFGECRQAILKGHGLLEAATHGGVSGVAMLDHND